MSDGICGFTDGPINKFHSNNAVKSKLTFNSVGFGRGADPKVLKSIANKMPHGTYASALTAEELTITMRRIIPNIYKQ